MNKQGNILLTGFRATGKTQVGRILAEKLGSDFIDTDHEICDRCQMSVAEMVSQYGWQYFREKERQLLEELSKATRLVVAVGGGAIEHDTVWKRLKEHFFIVWLQADIETIENRMASDEQSTHQRPALTDSKPLDEIRQLLESRIPLYEAGSDIAFDTTVASPEILAEKINAVMKDNN